VHVSIVYKMGVEGAKPTTFFPDLEENPYMRGLGLLLAFAGVVLAGACTDSSGPAKPTASSYKIDLRFFGKATTASEQTLFTNAAARIKQIVVGAPPLVDASGADPAKNCNATGVPIFSGTIDGIVIYASFDSIDGRGKVLAQSGPCYIRQNGTKNDYRTSIGVRMFDTADVASLAASGNLQEVITHEMLHVLGFGSFWDTTAANLLINYGTNVSYIGAGGIAGCKSLGECFRQRADDGIHQCRQKSAQQNDDKISRRPWLYGGYDRRRSIYPNWSQHSRRRQRSRSVAYHGRVGDRIAAPTQGPSDYSGNIAMTRLSIAAALTAITLTVSCARPENSSADTATASSTATEAARPLVDTLATTTESTKSVSTVTRTSRARKPLGSAASKAVTTSSARSINAVPRDSVLGRDSVIRFPIRRLPTASSSPVKR